MSDPKALLLQALNFVDDCIAWTSLKDEPTDEHGEWPVGCTWCDGRWEAGHIQKAPLGTVRHIDNCEVEVWMRQASEYVGAALHRARPESVDDRASE